jgi:hypothetical protein
VSEHIFSLFSLCTFENIPGVVQRIKTRLVHMPGIEMAQDFLFRQHRTHRRTCPEQKYMPARGFGIRNDVLDGSRGCEINAGYVGQVQQHGFVTGV